MLFELLQWLTAATSLAGVILNVRKHRLCFALWLPANLLWCGIDLYCGIYPQAGLQALYAGLSLWGLWEWRKGKS